MDQYTDSEWSALIAQTNRELIISQEPYPCPQIGSPAFMKTIDHTLLKLEARPAQFDDLCAEARVDGFATVCVRPPYVQKCVSDLKGSDIRVAAVIGFHEGTYDTEHKVEETLLSLQSGAKELDIVLNYPHLHSQSYSTIYSELSRLRSAAPPPTTLKLILETSQLDSDQILAACVLASAANFDYVKTSTGFNGPGATEEHVRLMAGACEVLAATGLFHGAGARKMKVKASGGIRTLADAVRMLEAGASRLGTSGDVWIAKEAREVREKAKREGAEVKMEEVREERPGLATRLFSDY